MKKRMLAVAALAGMLSLSTGLVLAADQERDRERSQTQEKGSVKEQSRDRERIYGSQLMTEQERAEYRTKMRAAKTAEERNRIRKEHHELMKVRAKERGVTLPDEPPEKGGGMMMGPGGGMGGMGPGGGRNR